MRLMSNCPATGPSPTDSRSLSAPSGFSVADSQGQFTIDNTDDGVARFPEIWIVPVGGSGRAISGPKNVAIGR